MGRFLYPEGKILNLPSRERGVWIKNLLTEENHAILGLVGVKLAVGPIRVVLLIIQGSLNC